MAVYGINSSANNSATSSSAFSDMATSDFIRIITEQLMQQDPFQPNDASALLEQISSIRNVESQMSLQSALQTLVGQNSFAAATQSIGKIVAGLDDTNNEVIGQVVSVRLENNRAMLELDTGKRVSFDRVYEIANSATPVPVE